MIRAAIKFFVILCLFCPSLHAEFVKDGKYQARGLGPEIDIGGPDSGRPGKFFPEIRSSFRFNTPQEKHYLNIRRNNASQASPVFNSDEIRVVSGNETDSFKIQNGRLIWDVIYNTDPRPVAGRDLVERWTLNFSPGVRFYFQPALTAQEIADGATRPPDVVGSYAVYIDQTGEIVDLTGNIVTGYGTGKLAHIYRPLVTDDVGNQTFADLNINGRSLTVTIPASFLDSATFPVKLDPDLGFTGEGASGQVITNSILGPRVTADSAGIGLRIWAFLTSDGGVEEARAALYLRLGASGAPYDTTEFVENSDSRLREDVILAVGAWYRFIIDGKPRIANGNDYWPVVWGEGSATLAYDAGAPNGLSQGATYTTNVSTNPWPVGQNDLATLARIYSVYLTYKYGTSNIQKKSKSYFRMRP